MNLLNRLRDLGRSPSSEQAAVKAAKTVEDVRRHLEAAKTRRVKATSKLPALEAGVIENVGLDLPPGKKLSDAHSAIVAIDGEIASLEAALGRAQQQADAAAALHQAAAYKEATQELQFAKHALEEQVRSLLPGVARVIAAESELGVISGKPNQPSSLPPLFLSAGGSARAPSPLEGWLDECEAGRQRALATATSRAVADREFAQWGLRMITSAPPYGAGDLVGLPAHVACDLVIAGVAEWANQGEGIDDNARAQLLASRRQRFARIHHNRYDGQPIAGSAAYIQELTANSVRGWDEYQEQD